MTKNGSVFCPKLTHLTGDRPGQRGGWPGQVGAGAGGTACPARRSVSAAVRGRGGARRDAKKRTLQCSCLVSRLLDAYCSVLCPCPCLWGVRHVLGCGGCVSLLSDAAPGVPSPIHALTAGPRHVLLGVVRAPDIQVSSAHERGGSLRKGKKKNVLHFDRVYQKGTKTHFRKN